MIKNKVYMKVVSIFMTLSLILLGCYACSKDEKVFKEEIRLLKEENSFLKAENIGLKKELEKLYKKLDESSNDEYNEGIILKPETKESEKHKGASKAEPGIKNKPQ